MQQEEIKISTQLAQATVNYLQGRPYAEVFQLIQAFQQAAQPQQEKVKEEATTKTEAK